MRCRIRGDDGAWVVMPAQANHSAIETVEGDVPLPGQFPSAEHVFFDRPGFTPIFHSFDGITTAVPPA